MDALPAARIYQSRDVLAKHYYSAWIARQSPDSSSVLPEAPAGADSASGTICLKLAHTGRFALTSRPGSTPATSISRMVSVTGGTLTRSMREGGLRAVAAR